jgi:hypothetical protein
MDSAASNYNSIANVAGNCTYPGCTDSTATNYDTQANLNDGSCQYVIVGCTDSTACNFNPQATSGNPNATVCDFITDICGICGGDSSSCIGNAGYLNRPVGINATTLTQTQQTQTVQIAITLPVDAANVYALYSTSSHHMYVPAAGQNSYVSPYGNIGGHPVDGIGGCAALASVGQGDCTVDDSFITIGYTDGSHDSMLMADPIMQAELQNWDSGHMLISDPAGGRLTLPRGGAYTPGTGSVVIMQLVLPAPGTFNVSFNVQGRMNTPACLANNATNFFDAACTWKAEDQVHTFSTSAGSLWPCPYDSRPAPLASGVCPPSSTMGCPDGVINVQDLQAMLSYMSTSLSQSLADPTQRWAGYPVDAHPAPSQCPAGDECFQSTVTSNIPGYVPPQCPSICAYGNNLINVHDLLGLLAVYTTNYNINPC